MIMSWHFFAFACQRAFFSSKHNELHPIHIPLEFLFVSVVFLLSVSFCTPRWCWCVSQKAIKKSRVRVFYPISLFATSAVTPSERQLPRPVMQEQRAARLESISNSIGEHWTLHSLLHRCTYACSLLDHLHLASLRTPFSHTAPLMPSAHGFEYVYTSCLVCKLAL
jgi:hypothetical protein